MIKKSAWFMSAIIPMSMLFSIKASAETIVATCYEPNGLRVDFVDGNFEEGKDGYTNSNPTFFFDSEKPNILIESWQTTLPPGISLTREEVDNLAPPTATESAVVFRSQEVIYAVSTSVREGFSTTLYLEKGIGIFTRVRFKPGNSDDLFPNALPPMGAVYTASCNFTRVQ